jgi:hypothetical protein
VLPSAPLSLLLPVLLSEVVADGDGVVDRDDAVFPLSPSLENGIVAAAISSEFCSSIVLPEFSEGIVDGHSPFTGIKPSGHTVDGRLTVLLLRPPLLLSVPLLGDGIVAADASSISYSFYLLSNLTIN